MQMYPSCWALIYVKYIWQRATINLEIRPKIQKWDLTELVEKYCCILSLSGVDLSLFQVRTNIFCNFLVSKHLDVCYCESKASLRRYGRGSQRSHLMDYTQSTDAQSEEVHSLSLSRPRAGHSHTIYIITQN